jgi:hypothetical protein
MYLSRMRSSIRRIAHAAPLLAISTLLAAACGPGAPAAYADAPDVAKAQGEWCAMLARTSGAGDAWEHGSACRAATPTASAAYLRRAVKCYEERLASLGKDAPDTRQIAAACEDEILLQLPVESAAGRAVLDARCDRVERCEKVAKAECLAATEKLEGAQRALFTSVYSDATLAAIEACVASSSCEDNEDTACYHPEREKLLWFPL